MPLYRRMELKLPSILKFYCVLTAHWCGGWQVSKIPRHSYPAYYKPAQRSCPWRGLSLLSFVWREWTAGREIRSTLQGEAWKDEGDFEVVDLRDFDVSADQRWELILTPWPLQFFAHSEHEGCELISLQSDAYRRVIHGISIASV